MEHSEGCKSPNQNYCLTEDQYNKLKNISTRNKFKFITKVNSYLINPNLFASVSFALNIIILLVLYSHSQEISKLPECSDTQKISQYIYFLNMFASMNAAFSLSIITFQYTHKILEKMIIALLILNALQLVYAVMLQIDNNDKCKTTTWIPILWLLPSLMLIYSSSLLLNDQKE